MAQIHRETGINVQTLRVNLKNLQEKDIVKKATVLLDTQRLGYSHHIIFFLRFQDGANIAFLQNKEAVNTILELDEKHLYFVEAFFESGASLDKFITKIEENTPLENVKFWVVKKQITHEDFLG